jgi:hypothetical protein
MDLSCRDKMIQLQGSFHHLSVLSDGRNFVTNPETDIIGGKRRHALSPMSVEKGVTAFWILEFRQNLFTLCPLIIRFGHNDLHALL